MGNLMVNPAIQPTALAALGPATPSPAAEAGGTAAMGSKDFRQVLLDSLDQVNRLQAEADDRVSALVRGESDNVAEVFTAVNKAGIAFDLLMEIRNKLLDAYQEINQMRISVEGRWKRSASC
jgi:flagellar hook-basal body complex protein FliE